MGQPEKLRVDRTELRETDNDANSNDPHEVYINARAINITTSSLMKCILGDKCLEY